MISIVKSLGAVLGASLIESQAWERTPRDSRGGETSSRWNSLGSAKMEKMRNYDQTARRSAGNLVTLPRIARETTGLSKSAATMPVPR
jgi:hypothetical protein